MVQSKTKDAGNAADAPRASDSGGWLSWLGGGGGMSGAGMGTTSPQQKRASDIVKGCVAKCGLTEVGVLICTHLYAYFPLAQVNSDCSPSIPISLSCSSCSRPQSSWATLSSTLLRPSSLPLLSLAHTWIWRILSDTRGTIAITRRPTAAS